MNKTTALDSSLLPSCENWEVKQFLLTPDAHRVINREKITLEKGFNPRRPEALPTYDGLIEAALAGDEPLEVTARPLPFLGKRWMVTLKNYPHIVVFVSRNKSKCETVARTRDLAASD